MRRALTPEQKQELARRVARVINDFVGTLHGARWIMVEAIRHAEKPNIRHAARYALQIGFGAIALTMRKFEDLWGAHMPQLIPDQADRPPQAARMIAESRHRSLRETADRLIGHYVERGAGGRSRKKR